MSFPDIDHLKQVLSIDPLLSLCLYHAVAAEMN